MLDNTTNYLKSFLCNKAEDDTNNEPTSAQEVQYRMSLIINENPAARNKSSWSTNPSLYKVTKLRTNLDYNISDMDEVLNKSENQPDVPDLSGG